MVKNTDCSVLDERKLASFIAKNITYVDTDFRLWSTKLQDGRVVKDEDVDTLTPSADSGFYYEKEKGNFMRIRSPKSFAKSFCENYK